MLGYDLVVIGTGTAAHVVSERVRQAGWSVAVIDCRPFGGTCALRGCDPKKVLVSATHVIDQARNARGHGVAGQVHVDWPELIAFKRTFTDPVPQRREEWFRNNGIKYYRGVARFNGHDTISVDGQTLSAGHVLIAAGAHPAPVRFPGAEHLITSEQFMTLGHLPPRIAMVGGGYIAAEFSHIAARAGAKVTVLQRGPRILPNFDPDLVSWLMEKFDELGIDVRTDHSVEAIERSGNAYRVHTTGENGNSAIDTDLVIHAAGRVPEIENLDLTAGDVALENGKIQLNEFLQSVSNPIVYAAGDAASKGPPLTPVATQDGKVVAANLLDGNCKRPDYRGVPSVAFSLPPIAAVGLSEAVVRKHDAQVRIKCAKVPDWNTAKRVGESVYGYKTIVDARNDRILGAHLVGPQADEVINLFGLAIRYGLTASDLKEAIFAYPTGASDLSHML